MVELQVAVQYRIKDAEDYLFKVRDPEATLGEVSESAIREVVGRNDQQAILEAGRIKIAEDTRAIMQRTLDQYGAGIEVRSVNITDVQVPEAVQQAQRDSVKAQGRPRTHDQGSPGLRERHPAQGRGRRGARRCRKPKRTSRRSSRWPPAMPRASRSWPPPTKRRRTSRASASTSRPSRACSSRSRKVIIDSKSGNGNMLYLPLDKLMERRDAEANTVTVRPPVAVEPDPATVPDARQQGGTLMGSRILGILVVLLAVVLLISQLDLRGAVSRSSRCACSLSQIIGRGLQARPALQDAVHGPTWCKFDRRVLTRKFDGEQFLTSESQGLTIDYYIKWRILDAEQFYQATSGGDEGRAESLVGENIQDGIKNAVARPHARRKS